MRVLVFAFVCVFAAIPAAAAVRLNEIAWMGTDAGGANCEWIELYNSGADVVDLANWSIVITNAGSATPKTIDLGEEGSVQYSGIAGNGFYLVARNTGSCATLVPGTTADWLGSFGNGISNTGAKIELFDGTSRIDGIDSTSGWAPPTGIGGKNTSGNAKQTPQYSGGVWITALPTPRTLNASAPIDTLPEEEEATSTPAVTIGGATPSTPVAHPIIKLYIDPGPDRIVTVGAHTPYEAVVYDGTGKIRQDADVSWNFGDGVRKSGKSVSYAYREAGEYPVTVRAKAKTQSAVATLTVVATDAKVHTNVSDRGIVVENADDRLVDLSSWKLSAGTKKFKLPEDTVIPAHSSILLPAVITGLPTSTAKLWYPDGTLAKMYVQPEAPIAGIQEVQEVVPVVANTPAYVDHAYAPDAPTQLAAAGAAMSGNVVLKSDAPSPLASLGSFVGSLLASVASFVIP